MDGFDAFMTVFGDMTIGFVITVIVAAIFCGKIYRVIKKYFADKIETEKKTQEALDQVKKYPEWRQQSREIQQQFQDQITGLGEKVQVLSDSFHKIDEENKKRERNRLRDELLKNYRHYTNPKTNPNQTWSRMESEAFWELFKDYEDLNGDGFIHTVVQPAMNLLTVGEND